MIDAVQIALEGNTVLLLLFRLEILLSGGFNSTTPLLSFAGLGDAEHDYANDGDTQNLFHTSADSWVTHSKPDRLLRRVIRESPLRHLLFATQCILFASLGDGKVIA